MLKDYNKFIEQGFHEADKELPEDGQEVDLIIRYRYKGKEHYRYDICSYNLWVKAWVNQFGYPVANADTAILWREKPVLEAE